MHPAPLLHKTSRLHYALCILCWDQTNWWVPAASGQLLNTTSKVGFLKLLSCWIPEKEEVCLYPLHLVIISKMLKKIAIVNNRCWSLSCWRGWERLRSKWMLFRWVCPAVAHLSTIMILLLVECVCDTLCHFCLFQYFFFLLQIHIADNKLNLICRWKLFSMSLRRSHQKSWTRKSFHQKLATSRVTNINCCYLCTKFVKDVPGKLSQVSSGTLCTLYHFVCQRFRASWLL